MFNVHNCFKAFHLWYKIILWEKKCYKHKWLALIETDSIKCFKTLLLCKTFIIISCKSAQHQSALPLDYSEKFSRNSFACINFTMVSKYHGINDDTTITTITIIIIIINRYIFTGVNTKKSTKRNVECRFQKMTSKFWLFFYD